MDSEVTREEEQIVDLYCSEIVKFFSDFITYLLVLFAYFSNVK